MGDDDDDDDSNNTAERSDKMKTNFNHDIIIINQVST